MSSPAELKYTKDHEWARIEGDNVRIGITQYAVDQLGDVTLVDLPKPGTRIEVTAHFGDMFAPVSGEIVAVNEELANKPELVNEAPYGKGWMLLVKPADGAQLGKLLDAAAYDQFLAGLGG